jgi:hypothetical protein
MSLLSAQCRQPLYTQNTCSTPRCVLHARRTIIEPVVIAGQILIWLRFWSQSREFAREVPVKRWAALHVHGYQIVS